MKPDGNVCANTKISCETQFSRFTELKKSDANCGVLLWRKFLEKSRPRCNLSHLVTTFPQEEENSSFPCEVWKNCILAV